MSSYNVGETSDFWGPTPACGGLQYTPEGLRTAPAWSLRQKSQVLNASQTTTTTTDGNGNTTTSTSPAVAPELLDWSTVPWGWTVQGSSQTRGQAVENPDGSQGVQDDGYWPNYAGTYALQQSAASAAAAASAYTDAQTAVTTARTNLQSAQQAVQEAQQAMLPAEADAVTADQAAYAAQRAVDVATAAGQTTSAEQAALAAAQAALTAAQSTQDDKRAAYGQLAYAYASAEQAVTQAQTVLSQAITSSYSLQQAALAANLDLSCRTTASSVSPGGNWTLWNIQAQGYYYNAPSPVAANQDNLPYNINRTYTAYQRVLSVASQDVYNQMTDAGLKWTYSWNERPGTPGSTPGTYTYGAPAPVSEVFDPSQATQQPDNSWELDGETHVLAAPADNGNVSLVGLPSLPVLAILFCQSRTSERFRQGWPEFVTAAAPAARYLTMTAGNAPDAPEGAAFAGTLALVDQGIGGPTPLVLVNTLSADANVNPPLPTGDSLLAAPMDGATVQSPTQRTMAQPAGLQWTLSNPQTPADILGHVEARQGPDLSGNDIEVGVATAIRFASDDHVVQTKCRYRFGYFYGGLPTGSGAPQATAGQNTPTNPAVFQYRFDQRDLSTGMVTQGDVQTINKTFPVPLTAENPYDPDSPRTAQYQYYDVDTDWTEMDCQSNQSVVLVLLPGQDDAPLFYTGYGNPQNAVILTS